MNNELHDDPAVKADAQRQMAAECRACWERNIRAARQQRRFGHRAAAHRHLAWAAMNRAGMAFALTLAQHHEDEALRQKAAAPRSPRVASAAPVESGWYQHIHAAADLDRAEQIYSAVRSCLKRARARLKAARAGGMADLLAAVDAYLQARRDMQRAIGRRQQARGAQFVARMALMADRLEQAPQDRRAA